MPPPASLQLITSVTRQKALREGGMKAETWEVMSTARLISSPHSLYSIHYISTDGSSAASSYSCWREYLTTETIQMSQARFFLLSFSSFLADAATTAYFHTVLTPFKSPALWRWRKTTFCIFTHVNFCQTEQTLQVFSGSITVKHFWLILMCWGKSESTGTSVQLHSWFKELLFLCIDLRTVMSHSL